MPTRFMLDVLKAHCEKKSVFVFFCIVLAVFSTVSLRAQSYTDLFDLDCPTGCLPYDYGHLVQGIDGYLYGTTEYGGTNNFGTIFKINPSGSGYTVLWNFDGAATGANPIAGLTLSSVDGNFYGTTFDGGTFGDSSGTVFSFNPSTNAVTVLHHFDSTENCPEVALTEGKNKRLYGMTRSGELFRITPPAGTFQRLTFEVGGIPAGPMILASDGNLYGTTATGGTKEVGTIFRMTQNEAVQSLYNFKGPEGDQPNGLVQGSDGSFYGTTYSDTTSFDGTVFKFTLKPSKLTTLHNFASSEGTNPNAALLAASDGNFYGTTTTAGTFGSGTIFSITSGGGFVSLFDFTGLKAPTEGGLVHTGMLEATNGMFYGLTYDGGANGISEGGDGVVYSVTPLTPKINITLCCNYWVILDQPVTILGSGLTGVISVKFGSVAAQFHAGSDTFLRALPPSGAIDGPVSVTLATGLQIQSQQSVHVMPKITNLDPSSGGVGSQVTITGGGFNKASKVTFGGVPATVFRVATPSKIIATVPAGAVTGTVNVTTPNGTAASKTNFTVN